MVPAQTTVPPAPAESRVGPPPREDEGRLRSPLLVIGVILVGLGLGWLLDTLGVVEMRWRVLVPLALVAVGVGLLATARRGGSDGLTVLGIVLGVLLLLGSVGTWVAPLGAVGDRVERPRAVDELESEYALGAGTLTLDLRELEVGANTVSVEASVGAGELVVRLPEDLAADVRASSGIGEVEVLDVHRGGFGASLERTVDGAGPGRVDLEVSVGLGRVEVAR